MRKCEIKKVFANEDELLAFAGQFSAHIATGLIVFLSGQLGAGKTTFARGLLHGLGFSGKVKSPTYTLVEPYEVNARQIYHFDLYRIAESRELDEMGLRDYFHTDAICLVEWPEKGLEALPLPDVYCQLVVSGDGREMTLSAKTKRGEEMLAAL